MRPSATMDDRTTGELMLVHMAPLAAAREHAVFDPDVDVLLPACTARCPSRSKPSTRGTIYVAVERK